MTNANQKQKVSIWNKLGKILGTHDAGDVRARKNQGFF